jgi:cystathionine gamma-lyase
MKSDREQHGFATRAIHAGQGADPATGATVVPIYATSTYTQAALGQHKGYEYSRSGNPTRTALEKCLAALEESERGLAFASGLAATTAALSLLRPGDEVVAAADLYGGTYRLLERVFKPWGLVAKYTDDASAAGFAQLVSAKTKLVWIETPTNPLLQILDIAAIAAVAHGAGALLAVDNTFASPYLQQPIKLGADLVVHSTTKYLGGHSDVVGGALVVGDDGLAERIAFLRNATGAVPGPFDSWLTLRGIKTLAVRMDRHCENATRVAEMLSRHPAVSEVLYPGLPSHPGHDVAAKQMRGFGGMVSFRVRAGADAAVAVCGRTRLFTLGESLGGVESLIEHPARMTHASAAGSALEVPADLIRLSVGIENCDDLLADLRQALAAS